MAKIKLRVMSTNPVTKGHVNKLEHRTDTVIKDPILGDVIKTEAQYFLVKTGKALSVDAEIELDLSNYNIEKTTFKNTIEESAYYGEQMESSWLYPKV